MGIVFRSGTKPDSLQENAWDVHNKSKNITEEGIKAAKYAEATIPYNKKNVLGMVEAHERLAPVLDKYKHEARKLERDNNKRLVERQIRNSQVREKNIQTRLDTDLKNLRSLQNIVTSTLGIARDVDKINRINAIERRDELTSIADRASLSYEKLVKHKTGTELLSELEQADLRRAGEARKNGLSELEIDKLLQPGGYYIRDAFTTQQAYRTAETFPGWVASISEKSPTELFSDSERGRGSLKANSYAQAKVKYANDNSVANAADLNAWQSAIENLFFEQNFKGTLIEGKFNLVTSNLFADTRDRVGTEGVVSAQKKLPQRKGLERTTVSNVRIQNYLNAGRQVSTWKEGDDPNKRFEFARDIPEAMGWDFEQQTRFTNNGSTGHEKRVNWMQDISRLGLKGDLTRTQIDGWLNTISDNGQTNRVRWATELNESGLEANLPSISKAEAERSKEGADSLKTLHEGEIGNIEMIFASDLPVAEKRKQALPIALKSSNHEAMHKYTALAMKGYNVSGSDLHKEIQQRIKYGTFTKQWLESVGMYNEDIKNYYKTKILDIQKVMPVHDESQPLWNSYYSSSADIVNQPPKQIASLGNAAFNLDGKPPDNVLHPTYSNFILEANGDMQMYYQEAMLTGIAVKSGDKSRQLQGAELETAAMRQAYAKLSKDVEDGKNGKGKYRLCPPGETGYGKVSMCNLSAARRSEGNQEGGQAKLKAMRETDNGMKKWAGTTGDGSGFLKNEVLSDYFFTPRDFFTKLEAYNKDPENNEMPTLPDAYYALQQTFGFDPIQTLLWQAEAYNKYQVKEGGDLIEFNPSMLPDNIVQAFRAYGNIPRQFLDPKSLAGMSIGKVLWESQFTNPSGQPTLYGIVGTDEEGNFEYELNPNYFSPTAIDALNANGQEGVHRYIESRKKKEGYAYGQDYVGISERYYND